MSKPYKTLICIDFETRWSSKEDSVMGQFTLSKMTTEAYIRDPRFKAFGACIHEVGARTPVQWYRGDELPKILKMYNWKTTAVLAHNAQFDAGTLSMVYGVEPCFIFDTLSMGRALRGVEVGNSLMKLAEDYGLPPKGRAVHSTDGLMEIPAHIEKELATYCMHDVFLCEEIFAALMMRIDPVTRQSAGHYPTKELRLIDMTVRMYTEPRLVLDGPMLEKALVEENTKLEAALVKGGVDAAELASNDQFAEVLKRMGVTPPTKISKATGKEAYAFAKNDALFQAMLNGDNEDIALLCEARLKVKSTLERTRAQRFIDIAERGPLPVPLSYYGAATGRFAAAEGSNLNLQNLKRGSFLRKAIMAPDGYVLCVGDLSQIEPRVLAWLADYEDMLDIFRAGGDPYATFGAQMFGVPGLTKETHPLLRQSAKSAMLGCFGSQTQVLTKRGWVTILDVTKEDLLWDGVEWVSHQGLLAQGEKEVLTAMGVSATSDHEILTEAGWQEWSAALQKPSLFQSALSLANLRASVGNVMDKCSTHVCAAHADGKDSFTAPISSTGAVHVAGRVHGRKLSSNDGKQKGTSMSARMLNTATDYLTVSAQSLSVAATQIAQRIQTTVDGVLKCILHGLRTVLSSYDTLSLSMVGTNRSFNLTGQTIAKDTNRATFDSLRAVQTWLINAESQHAKLSNCTGALPHLKQRMQTYDIAMAGPRNRYTILTDVGPIVVHNCGYQLGWASFAAQLLVGFLGAPPVLYNKAQARQLGVTAAHVVKFLEWDQNVKAMAEIPHTCTEEELLIHCLAAKAIIEKYRAAAEPVVNFWEFLGTMLVECLVGGKEHNHKGVLTFRKGEIEMVNGMCLRYPDLQAGRDDKGRVQYSYADGNKRIKIYPGKICNNVTQGLARIIMTDGMLRIQKRFPVKLTVHDEAGWLALEAKAKESYEWGLSQMVVVPKWMPGIPLNADGGFHKRYGMAKN